VPVADISCVFMVPAEDVGFARLTHTWHGRGMVDREAGSTIIRYPQGWLGSEGFRLSQFVAWVLTPETVLRRLMVGDSRPGFSGENHGCRLAGIRL